MEITVSAVVTLEPGRRDPPGSPNVKVKGTLTFTADLDDDLSRQQVESRIANLLTTDVRRATQIVAVGVKDKLIAAGTPPPDPNRPGPVTLIAGTKDERGRIEGKL